MRETINILGFVQSLFGILIFISKRPRHLSFILLAIWLSVNSIFLGAQLLPFEVVDYFKPGIFPLLFLLGPLLYLYVNSLATENYKLEPKHLIHLLPFLGICVHRSLTDAVSITSSSNLTGNPAFTYNKVYYVLLIISLFFYWVLSVRVILSHRKNIPFYFSNYTQKNTLSWLIFVVFIFLVLFLADLFVTSLARVFSINLFQFLSIMSNLTIFTFIMLFFGINQSVIYRFKDEKENSEVESEGKYKRSALDERTITDINKKVFDYLKTKKPYLNPDFSFQMMVNDLGISRQNLSQVINTGQKKNFYKLINEFRIKEVKEMLANPKYKHYTILGIAFDCGFNSKTSFNRIFKEETGLTPTAYKKSIQQ